MNTMTFFAGTELPKRVALTVGHRGYVGMNADNLRLANALGRSAKSADMLPDTAAISLRGESGIGLYKV